MKINIYTDASHCYVNNFAACGYVLVQNNVIFRHVVMLVEGIHNTQAAECYAAYLGMVEAFGVKSMTEVCVRTDSTAVIQVITGKKLFRTNHDDLTDVLSVYAENHIKVRTTKVVAHTSNYFNNKVDNAVRNAFRKHLKGFK